MASLCFTHLFLVVFRKRMGDRSAEPDFRLVDLNDDWLKCVEFGCVYARCTIKEDDARRRYITSTNDLRAFRGCDAIKSSDKDLKKVEKRFCDVCDCLQLLSLQYTRADADDQRQDVPVVDALGRSRAIVLKQR
jgi:hypothetical protein